MTLAIGIAALLAVVLALLAIPFIRRPASAPSRAALERAHFADRLRELERERARGVIDEAEAEASRLELQRRLLAAKDDEPTAATPAAHARRTMAAIFGLVSAGGLGLYFALGAPGEPDRPFAAGPAGPGTMAGAHSGDGPALDQMAERLAQRLSGQPGDTAGWLLLARTYDSLQRPDEAAAAYRGALAASGNRPDIVADYAELLYDAQGAPMAAEFRAMFETALTADPYNPKARYYIGVALADAGDLHGALQAWTDLMALSPADAPWFTAVQQRIEATAGTLGIAATALAPSAEARRLAGAIPHAPAPPGHPPALAGDRPPATAVAPPLADDAAAAIAALPETERNQMIRSMVDQLARRLNDNPADREGWLRLARAYDVLGETEKAAEARRRADAAH